MYTAQDEDDTIILEYELKLVGSDGTSFAQRLLTNPTQLEIQTVSYKLFDDYGIKCGEGWVNVFDESREIVDKINPPE